MSGSVFAYVGANFQRRMVQETCLLNVGLAKILKLLASDNIITFPCLYACILSPTVATLAYAAERNWL